MILNHTVIEIHGKRAFERLHVRGLAQSPKVLAEEACFLFMLSGDVHVYAPMQSSLIEAGSCMLSQCGNYHFRRVGEGADIDMLGVFFQLEVVRGLMDMSRLPVHPVRYLAHPMSSDHLLELYKASLLHYLEHPAEFTEEMRLLKLKELLLILAQSVHAPSVGHLISALFTPAQFEFQEVIRRNLYHPLSLDALAAMCHMSLATFKRRFKDQYGQSPAAYFLEHRLQRAAELLLLDGTRMGDVAEQSGFDSMATFNRQFKARYGCAPSAYRLRQLA